MFEKATSPIDIVNNVMDGIYERQIMRSFWQSLDNACEFPSPVPVSFEKIIFSPWCF
jgi:hypothetical protein